MTTVINTPGSSDSANSTIGLVVGLVVLLVVGALFFMYGWPMMNSAMSNTEAPKDNSIDVNVKLPAVDPAPTPTQPAQ